MRKMVLRDGRVLSYYEYGKKEGFPVVFSHGFGDSGLIKYPDDTIAESLNLRIIAPNEPGVGESSPMQSRTLADWAKDIEELVDYLGIDTFVSAGHSAGTAHALAVAYYMRNRVKKVVLAAALQTVDGTDNDKYLIPAYFKIFYYFHKRNKNAVNKFLINSMAKFGNINIKAYVKFMAKEAKADKIVFLDIPETKAMFEKSFEEGIKQGGEGMNEALEAVWDWGFDPSELDIPAMVFYGDKDDMISCEMTIGLAGKLKNAEIRKWDGMGHYGFVKRECWIEFLNACVIKEQ